MNLGKLAKFLGACAASLVSATGTASDGTNFSDQWWNPNESGWGISVLQQADVIFVDLFVYDTAGNPTWFTAAATQRSCGALSPATNRAPRRRNSGFYRRARR